MKWIYKITYPDGKIHIGKDLTGTATYFGSPNATLISQDFTFEELAVFTIRRELLWHSETANEERVNQKEVELINAHKSNHPSICYNRWPKFKYSEEKEEQK